MIAYLNGMFLPRSAATIPVGDRGFVFGDGVYEVWRVVNGRLFESDRHLARLAFGLGELKIARPEILNGAKLTALADRLLAEAELTTGEATLYVEITRGVAPRTHAFPAPAVPPTVYATVNRFTPADALRAKGGACITVPDIRWMRCDIKTIQLLPNVMANQAAVEQGAVDALMVRDGMITESSHANVMGVLDGVIRTHPTNHLILPGVTRAVVLEIAARLGIAVVEQPLSERDLERVEELFLTGTTTDVMPIVRVNNQPVGSGTPGPVATRLLKELRAYLHAATVAAHSTL